MRGLYTMSSESQRISDNKEKDTSDTSNTCQNKQYPINPNDENVVQIRVALGLAVMSTVPTPRNTIPKKENDDGEDPDPKSPISSYGEVEKRNVS